MVFAAIAGLFGSVLSLSVIFYSAAVFAAGMALAVTFINSQQVSQDEARGGVDGGRGDAKPIRELFRDHAVLIFTAVIVMFNVANAATLSLVSHIFAKQQGSGENPSWKVAAAVFVAEVVMVAIAAYTGPKADSWGRKPLMLVAFTFLAARNGLTLVSHATGYLIALQALDGVAAAIYGVLLTLVTADLSRGTGRFNFLQGAIQSSMGLGAFVSNAFFGFIAKSFGFNASFGGLAAMAVCGGILTYSGMRETKEEAPR